MKIFVAGGTGVLGRGIVAGLLDAGHAVTILARTPSRIDPAVMQQVNVVEGDALDAERIRAALVDHQPDLLMHQLTDLAAGLRAANAHLRIHATRNLVDAALTVGTKRIVIQSIAWCYEPGDVPAGEDVALDLASVDATRRETVEAVIAMERCAAELEHCVVLRNGTLYGPGTWYAPGGLMADSARAGRLAPGPDVTSFVQIDDAVAAAVAAISWPSGAVNVVDDEPAAASVWLPAFCDAAGVPPPAPGADAEPQAWARGALNGLARSRGWTPRFASWREGFLQGLG
jgi:nucleoside-diphosphate-sugar epimerase